VLRGIFFLIGKVVGNVEKTLIYQRLMQMGQKPSQKKINQMMNAMNKQQGK
jgi:uncharacterized protein